LLLDRFRRNPKVLQSLIKKNIRDLTVFYQRYPSIIEEGLLPQAVLPSELFDKPLKAKVDYKIYSKETSNLDIKTYEVSVSEDTYKIIKE
jgi:hypothetical protein